MIPIDYTNLLNSMEHKTPIINESIEHFNFLKEDVLSDKALFAVMQKTKNKIFHKYVSSPENLESFLSNLNKDFNDLSDLYISPNSFFIPRRRCQSLHKLGFLYVDIDNHNSEVSMHDIYILLFHLENEYFGIKVPKPSMIIFSGRGLQLYWKLKPLSYNSKYYTFWSKIEKGLINNMIDLNYNGFSVDKQVCDAARVLRLAGSYNTSAGKYAEILYISDTKYTLTDISQGYVFGGISSGKKYSKRRKKDFNNAKKTKKNFSDENLLLQLRLEDFYKLIEIRNGNLDGHRQYIIWMVSNILKQLNVSEEELHIRLDEVNKSFSTPLPQKEIDNELRNKKIYKFTNETLLSALEITEVEQTQLSVIKSVSLSKKQSTKQKRELLLQNIEILFYAGKTQKEIAAHPTVQRSERAVRGYLHELGLIRNATTTYYQIQKLKNLK